ncbi:cupin domain-containing protein [Bifidobacterium cuniculi]|uniref:Cytosolic protein n=1 Tax=Bifidobacterium cuniculi TaxID=1688 RepID=A0A087APP1_9BIFI|nr:cupin domain-containing protein [Bifidobacterium cuniculi]KFI60741.1 cytosolic protein [Bifidobacterium cuniculi]
MTETDNTKIVQDVPEGVPAEYAESLMFPVGAPNDAYAQYFTGRSWLAPVSTEQVAMSNVTFEPGCINHWHIHHASKDGGQILICVGGRGYAQIWGQEPIEMTPGTVVNIPANTKHWHGAAPDSWFSHIAVAVPGEDISNEWLEPVDEAEVAKLK